LQDIPVPKYLCGCGAALPWQQSAIDAFHEILREGDISEQQVTEAEKAVPDIVQDGPRTELASLKLGKLLKSLQKPVYEVAIKVVSDIASETAKKSMGLP
jgi:hypothetical protein